MFNSPFYKLVVLSIFILIFSCGRNPINHSDNYTNVDISGHIGDIIEIKILNESSDAGYRWNVTTDFNSTIASLISFTTEHSSDVPGAPMYEIWRYYLNNQGIDTLTLKLYRPWEAQNVIGIKSFYLTVQN
jgi:predicted secreted protein